MKQKEISLPNNSSFFWKKAIELTIIALVVLVPAVFYPRLVKVFNPPKELTFEILVIMCLMFWTFKMISQEKIKFIRSPLDFSVTTFMAICALSFLWSDSPYITLKELPLFLTGPLFYFIITNNINNNKQINHIISVMLIVGGLFGIYGILQYNGIDFSFWKANVGRNQVFGLFGNVNYFAEYLIVLLPLTISLFFVCRNKVYKILLISGILAIGGSIILTFTRGSYLAIGISSLFMFFLYLASRGKGFIKGHKKIFIFILALIVLVTFLFATPNPLNKPGTVISKIKGRISVAQFTQGSSLKRRIAIWKFTGMMIKDHPLLGSGLGTFKYNSLLYQAKFFDQGENRRLYPYGVADKAHNEYLQFGAEVGILGLGIFIWLLITYFNYGIKLLKRLKDEYKQGIVIGLMGGVMAVLVDAIFGFPLHLPATLSLFWLIIGLTIVTIKTEVSADKVNLEQKDSNIIIAEKKVENINLDKKQKKAEDKDNDNIYRFKPLLYLSIILLAIILSITIARPFIAQTYWYKGFKEIEKENWNGAIKIYEEALRWDPYLGPIYYDIGKILQDKELYGISREYLEKAAKYIDHPDLPLDLAVIYLKSGKLDKAATKLKQAISYQRDKKSMIPLYSELGNVYLQLERYKPAEIAFKNALKINPKYVNAHYGLAGAYLRQNKLDEAQEELQKVIELAPGSQEAKYARNIIQNIEQEKLKSQPTETNNP